MYLILRNDSVNIAIIRIDILSDAEYAFAHYQISIGIMLSDTISSYHIWSNDI